MRSLHGEKRREQDQEQGKARGNGEAGLLNDTMVTLVGNAATAVEHRQTAAGVPVARFRLAATSRRWDKSRECWTDGETSFYTIRAWRTLADNVAASVAVGEPLVVQGRLRIREGEQPPERGGQRWFAAEVDAVAIGHDLARGTAAFRRILRPRTEPVPTEPAPARTEVPPADRPEVPAAADGQRADVQRADVQQAGGQQAPPPPAPPERAAPHASRASSRPGLRPVGVGPVGAIPSPAVVMRPDVAGAVVMRW